MGNEYMGSQWGECVGGEWYEMNMFAKIKSMLRKWLECWNKMGKVCDECDKEGI